MQGRWAAARADFSGCLALSHDLNYTRGEAYALVGLASVDNATGDPNGALRTLVQAEELQRRTPDARLNAQIQLSRGTAVWRLQRGVGAIKVHGHAGAIV